LPATRPGPIRDSRADLAVAAVVLGWIGAVLLLDAVRAWDGAEPVRQLLLGAATWAVLAGLLRRETPLVRAQTLIVVALATMVEYTFSPLLHAYVYRIGTVPLFVPPGHGLVYLAALSLGRCALLRAAPRIAVAFAVLAGGLWAGFGALRPDRPDLLGLFWFGCLLGFLRWGRSRLLYVGAFVVVSYLELLGTGLGTWAWAARDPVLGVVGQGNPPSGAAGGYGWFDLYALLLAPALPARWARLRGWVGGWMGGWRGQGTRMRRTWSWSSPLVATALPPNGPATPSREVNRPPASTTTGTSAAMSYTASAGSAAMSTAPSASSMYDQKSP